jgi:hypothetical protein
MKEVLSGIEYIYIYPPVGDARVAKSSMIEVLFDKISGSFATAGPIYVYQYEYEEETTEMASGPMAQEGKTVNNGAVAIFPNPFRERLTISYQTPNGNSISLKIYDVTGRLVKRFNHLSATPPPGCVADGGIQPLNHIVWDGKDESNKTVAPGVYFITIENTATKATSCHKVIKVE